MSGTINLSKSIKLLQSKDNQSIELPTYCRKRISSLQYNKDSETLGIVCSKCGESFPILKLEREIGSQLYWKDLHDENEYHFMSETSGYASECMNCKNNITKKVIKKQIINDEEKLSYTVFLTAKNKRYLQLYKIVYEEEITQIINSLIDDLSQRKPIEVNKK